MFPPTESAASDPPADVAAGRLLAGLGIERLPVILLNLVGLADDLGERVAIGELVDDVIDDVAQLQLLGAGFRPCSCSTCRPSIGHAAMATSSSL
jgi:hypothetical protein